LLKHPKPEHRFVAAHLLDQLQIIPGHEQLLAALDDNDLRVTTRAMMAFQHDTDERIKNTELFERLERLLPRYPDKPTKLKNCVWPWTAHTVSKGTIADALPLNLGRAPLIGVFSLRTWVKRHGANCSPPWPLLISSYHSPTNAVAVSWTWN
jgi:hypothetical protein